MKFKYLVTLGIIGGVAFSANTLSANAEEVAGQNKETETNISIVDSTDPENPGVDPLDPTDPTQTHLTLENVPDAYDFETALKNGQYDLTTTLTDQKISVFNDRIARDWSVKATVKDNVITNKTTDQTFAVNNFKINDDLVLGTGATGIVARAASDKTSANNSGTINTVVNDVSIGFFDSERVLKADDQLQGTIQYTLYNTSDAS